MRARGSQVRERGLLGIIMDGYCISRRLSATGASTEFMASL